MILTISDSEEGILNKIKSVLACESTLEVMEITNSEKLTFQGLEIDQLQRSVIKDGKVVELTRHEYDLLFYLALSPNRVFTKEQIYQHIYEDVESEVDNRVYGLVKNLRKKIEENPEEPHYIETDTWCRLPFSGIKRAVRLGGSKYLNSSFLHCLFIVTGSIVISREEQILAKLLQFDLEAFPILNSRKHGKSF